MKLIQDKKNNWRKINRVVLRVDNIDLVFVDLRIFLEEDANFLLKEKKISLQIVYLFTQIKH